MLLGFSALLTQFLGDFFFFFTIYSDSWLFIADWQVFGLGMRVGSWEGRKELGTQSS